MAVGSHMLLELNGCPHEVLNDEGAVLSALRDAAGAAGATWLGEVSHAFDPIGVTAIGLLAQSHISIHTWPELGFAAVDVFTCGDPEMPEAACRSLVLAMRCTSHSMVRVPRTIGPTDSDQAPTGQAPTGQAPSGQPAAGQTATGQTATEQAATGRASTGLTSDSQIASSRKPTDLLPNPKD
ncbi:MAG: adenosylmethionine decarboxylase [Planctomycetota bacterium]